MNKGADGILQCDLWRELDASSREGSRIALKLERKGLINRERALSKGRWTYRLFSKRRPMTIDSILDIPCVTCRDILKCGVESPVSPNTCENLTHWLLGLAEEEDEESGT